jgi:hypothetical protein
MPYFPEGDPRNADPNANPNDTRIYDPSTGQYRQAGEPVQGSLSGNTGSILGVPDSIFTGLTGSSTSPTDWIKDMYSAQDANAGKIDARDFQYGGDAQLRNQTVAGLQQRGNENYSNLAEIGAQSYNALTPYTSSIAGLGASAQANGLMMANNARQLQSQSNALGNQAYGQMNAVPDAYGNLATQQGWQNSIQGLSSFGPGGNAQIAANAVGNFSPGSVNGNLQGSYEALQGYANQGPGPSAAEAQLNQALDANVASQIALARSGRGAGAGSANMQQAQFQAANLGQQTAGQAATLRAQEAATWRGQQEQALMGMGSIAGAQEQARQSNTGLALQAQTTAAGLYAGQDQARLAAQQAAAGQYSVLYGAQAANQQAADATRQGWMSQQQQALGQAAANQQAATSQFANAYNMNLGAQTSAAGLQQSANQNRVADVQAGLAQRAAYDQSALGIYENEAARRTQLANTQLNAQTQASLANQSADLEKDKSSAGMLGGLFLASDRRVKTSIARYSALKGQ